MIAIKTLFQHIVAGCVKSASLEIFPYQGENRRPSIEDSCLPQIFRRIVREGLLNKVFYNGKIRNSADFIRFIKSGENEIYFVRHEGKDVGFFWLERYAHRAMMLSYCFYQEFSGSRALDIGRRCFRMMLERKDRLGDPLFESIMIIAPSNNRMTLRFLRKNGLKMVGRLPRIIFDRKEDVAIDGCVFLIENRVPRRKAFFLPRPQADLRLISYSLAHLSCL